MAALNQIKRNADDFYALYAPQMIAAQDNYYLANGRYWQGLLNPTTIPDDGALGTPDLTTHPTDQLETWEEVFPFLPTGNWPVSAEIWPYDGPLGKGWMIAITFTKSNSRWVRYYNFGPETWRETADWVEIVPTEPEP